MSNQTDDISTFYRDLLVKIMGFGLAVFVVICIAMMGSAETELFSLEDPNQVAMDAAILKGEPNSIEYKAEFDKMEKEFKIINSTLKEIRDRTDGLIGNTSSLIDRILLIENDLKKIATES